MPHVLAKGRCAPRANSRPTRDGRAGQRGERTAEEEERGGAAPALLGVGYFRLLDCVEEAVPEAGLELKREAGKSVGKSGEEEGSGGGGQREQERGGSEGIATSGSSQALAMARVSSV